MTDGIDGMDRDLPVLRNANEGHVILLADALAMVDAATAPLKARIAELEDVQLVLRGACLLPKDTSAQAVREHMLSVAQSWMDREARLKARVAELEAENDALHLAGAALIKENVAALARIAELEAYAASLDAQLLAVSIATDARVQRVVTALKRHGAHDGSCGVLRLLLTNPPMRQPCDCGLSRAIEETP